MENKNLKIPVCYSFDTEILPKFTDKNIYIHIGAGGYKSEHIDYIDNTGDNISKFNKFLNEMTVIYWTATHYSEIGNPEYIGFCHYRRTMIFDQCDLDKDIILCETCNMGKTVYNQYKEYHNIDDLDRFIGILKVEMSNIKEYMDDFMNQKTIYFLNMFIMHRDKFFEYFNFIKKCIEIAIDNIDEEELTKRGIYQSRAYSFILERMTGFWIYYQLKTGKLKQKNIKIITHNIKTIYH